MFWSNFHLTDQRHFILQSSLQIVCDTDFKNYNLMIFFKLIAIHYIVYV